MHCLMLHHSSQNTDSIICCFIQGVVRVQVIKSLHFFIVVKATNVFLLYFKLLLQDVTGTTGRADGHRLALKLARAKLDAGLQVFLYSVL